MRTERKKQQKNRGFTLVEMIVTVAIIAIFSGVVLTAVTVGSNLYRNVSSNTKVQVDTQQLLDDMENLIIDANRSVYYANGSGNAIGSAISDDIDSDAAGDKTFLVCNEYENGDGTSRYIVDVLDWVQADEKIWYSQRQFTADSSDDENADSDEPADADAAEGENGLAVQSADDENGLEDGSDTAAAFKNVKDGKELVSRSVYAEGIKNFRADVSEVTSDRIVRFQLTTENHGKEINTLHTVNLRNRIQVMKPGDAFDDAKSSDVSISIIGAPESIDAGSSVLLSYKLIGDASIDPTTLKWTVASGDGSFPDADPTYGKLTASADGTGTITVTVSAKRADNGETITSAPVTIKINNNKPAKTVTGIQTDTNTVLVGAGCSVNLNSAVGWRAVYSDGSTGTDYVSVSWSLGDDSLATLGSDGQLSINKDAGAAGKGSFTVTAAYRDADSGQTFNGNVTVNVARIDLNTPGGTYNVGDQKPAPAYVYMEGGQRVSDVTATISTTKKPDGAKDYQGDGSATDGTFASTDVGDWEVKGSVNVGERGGYGTVESVSAFKVEKKSGGDIILNQNTVFDTVAAGQTYKCAPTVNWGFNFLPNVDAFWERSVITWSLKKSYPGISIKTTGDKEAEITVDAATKDTTPTGFVLCADYIQYTDSSKTVEKIRVHGEKAFNVAYGLKLTGVGDTVYYGDSYHMTLQMLIAQPDGTTIKRTLSENDTEFNSNKTWSGADIDDGNADVVSGNVTSKGEEWLYKAVHPLKDHKVKIHVAVWGATGVFYNDKKLSLQTDIMITVKTHEFTYSIEMFNADTGEKIKKYPKGQKVKIRAHVYYDGAETDDFQVIWPQDSQIKGNGHEAVYTPGQWDSNLSFQGEIHVDNKKLCTFRVNLNDNLETNFWQ